MPYPDEIIIRDLRAEVERLTAELSDTKEFHSQSVEIAENHRLDTVEARALVKHLHVLPEGRKRDEAALDALREWGMLDE